MSSSPARARSAARRHAPVPTSRPSTPPMAPGRATISGRWPTLSAPAARWTRTRPTSRRWARARARLPAIHGAADPAGSPRRRAALPDGPRRGRPGDELRPAHVAPDGASAGEGSDPAQRADLQSHDRRPAPGRGRRARGASLGVLAMRPKASRRRQSRWASSFSCATRS